MAISLASISKGKALRAPRIVLLGVEKIGKSTFASQAPATIFIPIKGETGLDEIEAAKFPPAQSFDEVLECLTSLASEDHPYQTIAIDSASALEPLIWDACAKAQGVASIEKVGGGFGKGYIEALKYWRELVNALDYLRDAKGMGCILIGHVAVKKFNDPTTDPYDTYTFDIQDKAANLLARWADFGLFANRKTYSKNAALAGDKTTAHATGTADPVLFTQKRPSHPGGGRVSLPYELKFTWADFEAAVKAARGN